MCATPALKLVPASAGVSPKESVTLSSVCGSPDLKPVPASTGVSSKESAILTSACTTRALQIVPASAGVSSKESATLTSVCSYPGGNLTANFSSSLTLYISFPTFAPLLFTPMPSSQIPSALLRLFIPSYIFHSRPLSSTPSIAASGLSFSPWLDTHSALSWLNTNNVFIHIHLLLEAPARPSAIRASVPQPARLNLRIDRPQPGLNPRRTRASTRAAPGD